MPLMWVIDILIVLGIMETKLKWERQFGKKLMLVLLKGKNSL